MTLSPLGGFLASLLLVLAASWLVLWWDTRSYRRRWMAAHWPDRALEKDRDKWDPRWSGYGLTQDRLAFDYVTFLVLAGGLASSRHRRWQTEFLVEHHPTERGRAKAARMLADMNASHSWDWGIVK